MNISSYPLSPENATISNILLSIADSELYKQHQTAILETIVLFRPTPRAVSHWVQGNKPPEWGQVPVPRDESWPWQ